MSILSVSLDVGRLSKTRSGCVESAGMMEIPLAFERAMGDRVTLNAEVRSVRQTADGVRVVYRNTRTGQEREHPSRDRRG